jgi:hypothetical protein
VKASDDVLERGREIDVGSRGSTKEIYGVGMEAESDLCRSERVVGDARAMHKADQ